MKLTNKSRVLLTSVLALMFLTCGCGRLMYFLWPFGRTQTFEAEFDGLESNSVAVVIFAGDQTQYEYPWATLNLSAMISAQLKDRVKDLTTVDAKKITAYQRKNLHWMSMDKTDLGKKLKANFILHISLIEFSTAEKGTVDTLRGVINGEIKLYDCSKPEDDSCVWTCENIRLRFPKIPTIRTPKNEQAIRESIIAKFSDKLTKKFYTYTVDKEDLEKPEDQ